MRIVWDEPKREANLSKHSLDFADLDESFFDYAMFLPSYGRRWRAIGETIQGVVRPASKYERKLHADR